MENAEGIFFDKGYCDKLDEIIEQEEEAEKEAEEKAEEEEPPAELQGEGL